MTENTNYIMTISICAFITALICFEFDKYMKKRKKKNSPHRHTMELEKSTMVTVTGTQRFSRYICSECGYIDYDHFLTNIKKPKPDDSKR